jgi:hypothetical protein
MRFAFLGYGSEQNWDAMSKGDQDAMIEECFAYDKKLLREGYFLDDGAALRPSQTAKSLRWERGAVVVTDGPFVETKEHLGGVGVLEARDMDHAVELMSKHPGLRYGAIFEVRPVDEESRQRLVKALASIQNPLPVDHQTKQFACLGYVNPASWATKSKADFEGLLEQCIAFEKERVKKGQYLTSIGMQDVSTAKRLQSKGGQVMVTDGPFSETKEYLGGIVVLALKDWDAAVKLWSQHPALSFGVGMELRPIDEEITKRWEALK